MPTLPWTAITELDDRHEYFVMATRFSVARRRHLPEVVRSTGTLWSALAGSDALAGYGLRAGLARGTLSTLSVWQSRSAMDAFVRGPAHAAVVRQNRPRMAGSIFVGWTAPGAELPPTWATVDRRIRDHSQT